MFYSRSLLFFRKYELNNVPSSVENVYDLFINVFKEYSASLHESINLLVDISPPTLLYPMFYNYLIMDGHKLRELLDTYNHSFDSNSIKNSDFDIFKSCCFYVGKGKCSRKFQHVRKGAKLMDDFCNAAQVYINK